MFDFRVFFLLDWLLNRGKRDSLSYYLPIAEGRIIGFIPFPRVLVLCEMQSASCRIWTRVAVSISYDDNYNTPVCMYECMYVCVCVCACVCVCVYLFLPT